MKKLMAVLFALFVLGASLGAQAKAALVVKCSQGGAQVFVNGNPIAKTAPNATLMLSPGTYQIKVTKEGFEDFTASVTHTAKGSGLQVDMVPKAAAPAPRVILFGLSVAANVPAASVAVNGQAVGKTPWSAQLAMGGYTVVVSAPGYIDFTQNVALNSGPVQVNAVLQLQNVQLSVAANVGGADVYINGNLAGKAPFTGLVPPGSYAVVVKAANYNDYSQNVTLSGPTQVNAVLQLRNVQLSVSSNVAGADVYINGNPAGKAPFSAQVPPGSYIVAVKAPNYVDYSQNVTVTGPTQVSAQLLPVNYQLDVDATVKGAEVSVNGKVYGQTPWAALLPPGAYVVGVRAAGYQDFSTQVTISGPQKVFAALQPLMATWQIAIPEAFVNKDLKGGHWSQVQVFVDGALLRGSGGAAPTNGQFVPGTHTIRISSGALAAEARIDAQAGKTYTIEPALGLSIK